MVQAGELSLWIAFFVCGYALVASALGGHERRQDLVRSAVNAVYAAAGLLTLAMAALVYAFLARDFQVAYVARTSSRDLPILYTLSAVWGGQEGSLLLWAWLLAVFSVITVVQNRKRNRPLMPAVVAVLMGVQLFFLVLLVMVTPPLARLAYVPPDGSGLNPLLQNPGMIIHPPTLLLGYVGFTVPFAFAVAALVTGRLGDDWIRSTRRWVLFSWLLLGVGIYYGGRWAYVELGWGGYWGWDPVENASLMPWLTGTAFLHSVMIQERKNMLKVWNILLIALTFFLSIFGTFITRSGIISSVHSFGRSALGPFFLVFIVGGLAATVLLLVRRLPLLRGTNELDSLVSRESSFLYNNLILVGATFTVFLGTVFPFISEAVQGRKITVGPPFFNQVILPIGLALIFLTGVCPLLAWRKASGRNLRRNLLGPALIALAGGAALFAAGVRHPYALLAFTLCLLVLASIGLDVLRGVQARRSMTSENPLTALARLVARNKRRYGGYVVHVGMVIIFLGMAGTAFKLQREVRLAPGESAEIGEYRLTLERLSRFPTASKEVTSATLAVERRGRAAGAISPAVEHHAHGTDGQTTTEVAIRSRLKDDLYVILAGYELDNQTAVLKLIVNPLVSWVWFGGLVVALGTVLAFLPDRTERRKWKISYTREELPEGAKV